jgi:hypothetical protein
MGAGIVVDPAKGTRSALQHADSNDSDDGDASSC